MYCYYDERKNNEFDRKTGPVDSVCMCTIRDDVPGTACTRYETPSHWCPEQDWCPCAGALAQGVGPVPHGGVEPFTRRPPAVDQWRPGVSFLRVRGPPPTVLRQATPSLSTAAADLVCDIFIITYTYMLLLLFFFILFPHNIK